MVSTGCSVGSGEGVVSTDSPLISGGFANASVPVDTTSVDFVSTGFDSTVFGFSTTATTVSGVDVASTTFGFAAAGVNALHSCHTYFPKFHVE